MQRFLFLVLALLLPAANTQAGPNAGGTLIVHNTGLTYGAGGDTVQWCSQGAALASCALANSEVDDSTNAYVVWEVYAAFDSTSSPRLKGLDFGVNYDAYDPGSGTGSLVLLGHGPCIGDEDNGAHEFPGGGWPAPGTNNVLVFQNTQTAPLVESYWFAGYAYYGAPGLFELTKGQFGTFADDVIPAEVDSIAGYGKLGFNEAGYLACPSGGGQGDGAQNGPHGGDQEGQNGVGSDQPAGEDTSAPAPPSEGPILPYDPATPDPRCVYPIPCQIDSSSALVIVSDTDSLVFTNTEVIFTVTAGDTLLVNGHQVMPPPKLTTPPVPDSVFENLGRNVPMVQDLQRQGYSLRNATQAFFDSCGRVRARARKTYRDALAQGSGYQSACDAALAITMTSPLIDPARTYAHRGTLHSYVNFSYRGYKWDLLDEVDPPDPQIHPTSQSRKSCEFVQFCLPRLSGKWSPYVIHVKGGGYIACGPENFRRMQQDRRWKW